MTVDELPRTVGHNGLVTADQAVAAAAALDEFTQAQLADRLGVKPVAAGPWVRLLVGQEVIVRDVTVYRYTGGEIVLDEPEEPAEPEGPSEEELEAQADAALKVKVRDAIIALQRFTAKELAQYLGVRMEDVAWPLLSWMDRGVIVYTGMWKGLPLFEYAPPTGGGPHSRPKGPRAEEIAREEYVRAGPQKRPMEVAHGGAPQPSNNREINAMVAEAWAAGWEIKRRPRGRHAVIYPPHGRPLSVPSTPSQGMVRAFRDELRSAGLRLHRDVTRGHRRG